MRGLHRVSTFGHVSVLSPVICKRPQTGTETRKRCQALRVIATVAILSVTVITMSRSYLLVIGDAAPLAWVLADQRMAFPALRRSQAAALEIGDELIIYTTRGCFHRPTRDRGRVMGLALVSSDVHDLAEPVVFGEHRYTSGCMLDIQGVAPLRDGVELGPLVPQLHAFPDARTWSVRLRRPLVRLDEHDAVVLKRKLNLLLKPLLSQLDAYIKAGSARQTTVERQS
jgi:hypothetical protein